MDMDITRMDLIIGRLRLIRHKVETEEPPEGANRESMLEMIDLLLRDGNSDNLAALMTTCVYVCAVDDALLRYFLSQAHAAIPLIRAALMVIDYDQAN